MNWYKKSKTIKKSSKEQAANIALQELNNQLNPMQVVNNFIKNMSAEDPGFSRSPQALFLHFNYDDINKLQEIFSSYITPVSSNEQNMGNIDFSEMNTNPTNEIENIDFSEINNSPTNEMGNIDFSEMNPSPTNEMGNIDFSEMNPNPTNEMGNIDFSEMNPSPTNEWDGFEDLENLGQDSSSEETDIPSFDMDIDKNKVQPEENISEQNETIEGFEDDGGQGDGTTPDELNDIIEESIEEHDGDETEAYEELFLQEIPEIAQDPNKPIMVDPTIRKEIEVPIENLGRLYNRIKELNKKLVDSKNEPWQVEILERDFPKNIISEGKLYPNIPHARIRLSGTLPIVSDQTSFRVHEEYDKKGGEKGRKFVKNEEKGIAIIGYIEHRAISKDREEEILNKKDPRLEQLQKHILECREKGEVPYYNEVQGVDNGPNINGRFAYTPPTECCACGVQHRRTRSYVCVVVDPDNLVPVMQMRQTENGYEEVPLTRMVKRDDEFVEEPVKKIPEALLSSGHQEQIGGSCAAKVGGLDIEKRMRSLETNLEIPDSLKKGKAETEEDKQNREQIQENGQTPWKTLGWNKIRIPTENIIASVVSIMRNQRNLLMTRNIFDLLKGDKVDKKRAGELLRYLRNDIRRKSFAFTDSLKDPDSLPRFRRNMLRKDPPKISPQDLEIAEDIRAWWASKFGGIEGDIETRNMSNIGIHSQSSLEPNTIKYVMMMVDQYLKANNMTLDPIDIPIQKQPVENNIQEQEVVSPENEFIQETQEKGIDISPEEIVPEPEPSVEEEIEEGIKPNSNFAVEKNQEFITPAVLEEDLYSPRKRLHIYKFVDPNTGNRFNLYSYKTIENIEKGKLYNLKGTSFGTNEFKGELSTSVSNRDFEIIPDERIGDIINSNPEILNLMPKTEDIMPEVNPEEPPAIDLTPEEDIVPEGIEDYLEPENYLEPEEIIEKNPESISRKNDFPNLIPRAIKAIETGFDNNGNAISPREVFNRLLIFLSKFNKSLKDEKIRAGYSRILNTINQQDNTKNKNILKNTLQDIYEEAMAGDIE